MIGRFARLARTGSDHLYRVAATSWVSRRTFRPTSSPSPRQFARFGDGSWVVPPAAIDGSKRIEIGSGTTILEYSRLVVVGGALLRVGSGVRLARFNTIVCGSRITIGDEVSSSDYVAILDTWRSPEPDAHALAGLPLPLDAPVVIGSGAYLGCGSTIYPGVTVGEGAYIGEGAVVTQDVPAGAVVYGNPAVAAES